MAKQKSLGWLDKYDVGGPIDPFGLTVVKKDATARPTQRVLTTEENKRIAENRKRKAAEEAAKNRPQLSANNISPEQRARARKAREMQEYINNSQLAQSLQAMSTTPGMGAIAAQTITEMNPAMSIARLVNTAKDPANNPYGIDSDAGALQNTLGTLGLVGDAFDFGSMMSPAAKLASNYLGKIKGGAASQSSALPPPPPAGQEALNYPDVFSQIPNDRIDAIRAKLYDYDDASISEMYRVGSDKIDLLDASGKGSGYAPVYRNSNINNIPEYLVNDLRAISENPNRRNLTARENYIIENYSPNTAPSIDINVPINRNATYNNFTQTAPFTPFDDSLLGRMHTSIQNRLGMITDPNTLYRSQTPLQSFGERLYTGITGRTGRPNRVVSPSSSGAFQIGSGGPLTNKSGFTKEDVLARVSDEAKEAISKMSEDEFAKSVLTPSGNVAKFTMGDPSQNLRNTGEIQSLTYDEYAERFNSQLDLLNDIIARNNKSGVDYTVSGIDAGGQLKFYTPSMSNNMGGVQSWSTRIVPGEFRGEVQDVGSPLYYQQLPGINMSATSASVFPDYIDRRGTGTYKSINEYLKTLDLGRVKPGFNSQSRSSFGLWDNAVKKGTAFGYYNDPRTVYGAMKKKGGKIEKNAGWLDKFEDGGELNYNNYNVSFSPDFVGEGYNTKGRNYSPAWGGQFEDGGVIPTAQGGRNVPATRSDSINVYNSAKAISDYYNKQGYVKADSSKEIAAWNDIIKDRKKYSEAIKNNKKYNKKDKERILKANNEIIDESKAFIEKIKGDPKNYLSALEKARKDFEADDAYNKSKNRGYKDQEGVFHNVKPSLEEYYKPIDENTFNQREQSYGFLDLRSPMPLYDKRITPQGYSHYVSPKSLESVDNVQMYEYDPLATMPWDMIPIEQQQERIQKYGTAGAPADILKKNPSWTKPAASTPIATPSTPQSVIDWMEGNGYAQDFVPEAAVQQQARPGLPFGFIEDPRTHQMHKYRTSTGELEYPFQGGQTYVTPQMAMGGSMPGSVGFTYARTGSIPSNGKYAKKTMASAQNGEEISAITSVKEKPAKTEERMRSEEAVMDKVPRELIEEGRSKFRYNMLEDAVRNDMAFQQSIPLEDIDKKELKKRTQELLSKREAQLANPSVEFIKGSGPIDLTQYGYKPTDFLGGYYTSGRLDPLISLSDNLDPYHINYFTGTLRHETRHAYDDAGKLLTGHEKKLILDKIYQQGQEAEVVKRMDALGNKKFNYITTPTEVTARLQDIRGALKDNPRLKGYQRDPENPSKNLLDLDGKPIPDYYNYDPKKDKATLEHLNTIKNNPGLKDLLKVMNPEDVVELLNTIAANNPQQGMPMAQNGMEMSYYQNGLDFKPKSISKKGKKIIKDDRGQWDHPGEITEIDSNNITMQGVPYPVLGISDTGDTQMMYPDQEYQYDGNSVTEYPMMQKGGTTPKVNKATVARNQRIAKANAAQNQPFSAESFATRADAIPDRLQLSEQIRNISPGVADWMNNHPTVSYLDQNLNPLVLLGKVASGLGHVPLNIKQGNYEQAVLDVLSPMVMRPGVITNRDLLNSNKKKPEGPSIANKYKQGGQLTKLDQLTNFTNYNTKQPGGWLDKYQ